MLGSLVDDPDGATDGLDARSHRRCPRHIPLRTRPLIDFRCVAERASQGTDTSTVPETLRIEMRPSPDASTLIRPLTFFTSAASVSLDPDGAGHPGHGRGAGLADAHAPRS